MLRSIRIDNRRTPLPVRTRLTVSITDVTRSIAPGATSLPAFAADLEEWGADQLAMGEHLLNAVMAVHPGGVAFDPRGVALEPLTTFAAVATSTTKIRLGSGIVIAPLRPPVLLAKMAATLDALSGGRLDLGLGAGWSEPEFAALGIPFHERFARLEEAVSVCRALWGPQPASFQGRWSTFEQMYSLPAPTSATSIPIWLGGHPTPITARRIARAADGWLVSEAASLDDISRGVRLIEDGCNEIGRDASEVSIRATIPRALPDRHGDGADALIADARVWIDELRDRGVTHVSIPLAKWASTREDARRIVLALARHVRGGRVSSNPQPARAMPAS